MALHVYHPNKSNKGYAASFWRSERDGNIFATLVRQSGWDEKEQNGLFKDNINNKEGHVNIKLSTVEVGGILDCIERNRPFSAFHDNDETPKQVSFSPWKDSEGNPKGFSFSITVSNKQNKEYKNAFYIGLTFAESRLIREFLVWVLHRTFEGVKKPTPIVDTPIQTVSESSNDILNFE